MKKFAVEFNLCDSEFMIPLRLVAGAVCSSKGIDVLEDFKVCVTESALILKNCGFLKIRAEFCVDTSVSAVVCGLGGEPVEGDNELSLALIGALVEECDIHKNGRIIDRVTLKI